jgi:hypothetical protein
VSPSDLTVTYQLTTDGAHMPLSLVQNQNLCGSDGGFVVDDPTHPTFVQLCPASCTAVHASTSSRVSVTAGCGAGAPDGGFFDGGDGGIDLCPGVVEFECVTVCGSHDLQLPVCQGRTWVCPAGTVSTDSCNTCTPVPHGCCKGDGTLAQASCVNGGWVCPPGSTIFGSGSCKPPQVCAAQLPCANGQYCKTPDFNCGTTPVAGACAPVPSNCPGGGPAVCGCDGMTYPSTCAASAAGVDIAVNGSCGAPIGTFACGPLFCSVAGEVCKKTQNFVQAIGGISYACIPSTPACPTGCGCGACLPCPAGLTCHEACSQDASGGRLLTCAEL